MQAVGHNNVIHLNGKQYDAITGALLSENRINATPAKRQIAAATAPTQGTAMDGVVRTSNVLKPAAPKQHTVARTTTAKPRPLQGKKFDIQRPASQHVKPHKAERSKTLMRHVVPKPQGKMKPAIKTLPPTELAARPVSDIARPLEKKLSVTNVDPIKLSHAKHVPKSHHIKRFTSPADVVAPKLQSRPAAALPTSVLTQSPVSPARPAAQSSDIFEAALARATSHQQVGPKISHHKPRTNRKLVSVMAGIAAFLVIGGFVTYLNMPAIELRVASIQAGFSATLPDYKPTGYTLAGNIESSDNKVTARFRSGDSSYKVSQAASDWNSQTLLDSYTEAHGAPERTIQRDGRTIYIYDNTRATWVNGGVQYEVTGNAALTTDDIVSIATSM